MSDPITIAAQAVARRLETEAESGLVAEVEAILAGEKMPSTPQYADPIGLASLIVSIVSLAWTVYADVRKRTDRPSSESIARTVRVTLRERGEDQVPDRIVDIVATEVIRTAVEVEASKDWSDG